MIAAAIEMGDEIPSDFIAPEIPEECVFAHRAFIELSTDRQIGFGEGPIPWTSIDAYASRYCIRDVDEFDLFAWMIRTLDDAYLSHKAK